jgi:hypothetical protein
MSCRYGAKRAFKGVAEILGRFDIERTAGPLPKSVLPFGSPCQSRQFSERGAGHQTGGTRLEPLGEIGPRVSRIAVLAAELVDLNVDVIVVTGF